MSEPLNTSGREPTTPMRPEAATLREALLREPISENDVDTVSSVDYVIDNLDPDWAERVAEVDEWARLVRLLPDDTWGWTLTSADGRFEASAWSERGVQVVSSGIWRTRLEALRALNDALERRRP